MDMMEYGSLTGIIYFGSLEKRRDGAVRGGWAKRTFLLTPTSIHYFRRVTENDLIGEERDQINLNDIIAVNSISEEQAHSSIIEIGKEHHYLEIQTNAKPYIMRLPRSEASTCENWAIAINNQIKVLKNMEEPCRGNQKGALQNTKAESILSASALTNFPPEIMFVSVVNLPSNFGPSLSDSITMQERIIRRDITWGEEVDLGVCPQGGACSITLRSGGYARIGTQALMSSWDGGKSYSVEVTEADFPTEILVSASCQYSRQVEKEIEPSKSEPNVQSKKKKLQSASSICYLLICALMHFLYGVGGFHWSHKICTTIGAGLAITSLFFVPQRPIRREKTQPTGIPDIRFKIKILRCKFLVDGQEFFYPEEEG